MSELSAPLRQERLNWKVLILSFVVIGLLISQVDLHTINAQIPKLKSLSILAAFLIYILSFLLRAIRWSFLINNLNLLSSFHIVSLHTVSNNILPFRSGELTFPYFCRKLQNIPISSSLPALLSARLSDLCTLGLLLITSLLYAESDLLRFTGLLTYSFILLCIVIVLPKVLKALINWSIKKRFLSLLHKKLSEITTNYEQTQRGRKFYILTLLSISIWLVKFWAFFLVAKHLNLTKFPISYWKVVFGATASEIIAAMPIQIFAEFGMFEAGWTGAFILMGMNRKDAITMGFSLHITILLFSALLGIPAYIIAIFRRKQ